MALTCGGSCAKMLLFIFNSLFFIGGVVMMGLGIWFLVDTEITGKFDQLFTAAAITIITVGTLILIIAFFGCCGACRESPCMLCVFIVLIVIILILEIVTAVLAGVFKDEVKQTLHDDMKKQVVDDVTPIELSDTPTSLTWHRMQHDLACCGADDYNDYRNNSHFNTTNPMPKTCCKLKNDDIEHPEPENWDQCRNEFRDRVEPAVAVQLHAVGCYPKMLDWFTQKAGILIGIACAVAFIQLLGITFACCVRNELTRHKEVV